MKNQISVRKAAAICITLSLVCISSTLFLTHTKTTPKKPTNQFNIATEPFTWVEIDRMNGWIGLDSIPTFLVEDFEQIPFEDLTAYRFETTDSGVLFYDTCGTYNRNNDTIAVACFQIPDRALADSLYNQN